MRKRVFAVCLTFYIIVVVINKEENLQLFLRVHLDKMCPRIWFAVDAQGRVCSVCLLPEKTLTPSRKSPSNFGFSLRVLPGELAWFSIY